MKIKTINKVLIKKLNEWLETITDVQLRKKVKSNLLVSGGSITSMLLKEPVNDYDIYLKDMDVLIQLAKYYMKNENEVLDGRMKKFYIKNLSEDKGYSAEGDLSMQMVRYKTLHEDQVKLDINSSGVKLDVKDGEKYVPTFLSQNAISLTDDIQIVLRFHGTSEEIHKTFDFIHATNYFTFEEGLVTNIAALQSILTKELKYQGSLYPLTSIIRMKKFLLRGWSMNAGEILKIMFQISELNLRDIEVLEEQLIGVDVAYFSTLIEILRNTKGEISSAYLNTIIERVFDSVDEEI